MKNFNLDKTKDKELEEEEDDELLFEEDVYFNGKYFNK